MNSLRLKLGGCIAAAAACAVTVIGWPLSFTWRFVLILVMAVMLSLCGFLLYREERMRRKRVERSLATSALELMNHQRHDWMNDLQLVYGYVRLKKFDKLPECVETIKERMTEESRIAKLGVPELVMFLMQQRLSGSVMPLRIEIPEPVELNRMDLSVDPCKLAESVIASVQAFRFAAKAHNDGMNPLSVEFAKEDGRLVIRYQYEGILLNPDEVESKLKHIASVGGLRLEQSSAQQNEEHEAYRIVVPCNA